MACTLSQLAAALGLDLRVGDRAGGSVSPETPDDPAITGVNTLDRAGPAEVSFFANPKYAPLLASTKAAAVIVDEAHAHLVRNPLVSANPYYDFARAVALFARPQGSHTGVSPLASVHPEAVVDPTATVYPFVYIGARAVVGPEATLFPGCYVGEDSVVGGKAILYPGAVLMAGTVLGREVILQAGAVLGSDGFGFAPTPQGLVKFPQIGTTVVGDQVEIGANTTIDRAALGETKIGSGTKIDNLVQIGHNVEVGEHSILVAQVGISGSTKLGKGVVLAGQVGVSGHLTIGDGVRVAAKSGIPKDIPAGAEMGGIPAMDGPTYRRYLASAPKLPELVRKVRKLEAELAELKKIIGRGDPDGEVGEHG